MAQSAAHLVASVFPDVPVRQWVLSVPKPLRLAMAMDPDLCRDVTRAHLRAVSASYVRRAKAAFELEQPEALVDGVTLSTGMDAVRFHPGAVNATQRFGSSLELNVHFHSIYLDGVYVSRSAFDRPVFVPAGPLDAYELNPSALGLPPRDGDAPTLDPSTDGDYEQPLLDFGDAREGPFFPSLKSALRQPQSSRLSPSARARASHSSASRIQI